jgi:large subunit ribosomal protein L15
MMLHEITGAAGRHKRRKRVGRGESSGWGKTCTRGHKGCQSRSGGGVRPLTEGGQMPIFRRLPKRGFSNAQFCRTYETVNLFDLERCFDSGETVDPEALHRQRLIRRADIDVKLLGNGTLSKKITLRVHMVSSKAREAIEKAGGSVELIAGPGAAEKAAAKRHTKKPKATPASAAKAAPAEQPAAQPPAEPEPPAATESGGDATASEESKE